MYSRVKSPGNIKCQTYTLYGKICKSLNAIGAIAKDLISQQGTPMLFKNNILLADVLK